MTEYEDSQKESLLKDGITVGQFVNMTEQVLERDDVEPRVREILERVNQSESTLTFFHSCVKL